ncbi:MAG: dihydroorotase [Clostridia bacterium]|nr:dihydroorotase [Clostridia bacterium]
MVADIYIGQGIIQEVGPNLTAPKEIDILEAEGFIITPGLLDMHTHLREPGFEDSEDIESGTRAAVHGGFTAVACMPNTKPVIDNAAVVRSILARAEEKGSCRVYPIGSITKGLQGEELAEMGDMVKAGVVAVSDDGMPVANSYIMRNALQYAKSLNIPVISHCEEPTLSSGGVMNEGYMSTVLGLKGIPAAAEDIMVARDLILAETTGARVHIAHISTKGSVEIVRAAKDRGIKVTCEATPHHFSLTDNSVRDYDTNTKVNPPLRTDEDLEAVIAGLKDGTIDVIASDHAPHTIESKDVEYDYAPFGISGLETSLPLMVSNLIIPGELSWMQTIRKTTYEPAKILNIKLDGIRKGSPADITVINPNSDRKVDTKNFISKGKNSPFDGENLKGWATATICNGTITSLS